MPVIPVAAGNAEPYEYSNIATTNTSFTGYVSTDRNQFDVVNREQRTPGSLHTVSDSNQYRSPVNMNTDMDTSPDGSGGGGGQHTPSSQQNNSSHTSNTAYSPPNAQNLQHQQSHQTQPQHIPNSQAPNLNHNNNTNNPTLFDPTFSTTFEIPSYPSASFDPAQQQHQPQTDFLQSQVWEMGGTGLTPGASGGPDIMNMSDVDWNQMMEGLGDWNQQMLVSSDNFGFDSTGQSGRRT